MLKRILVVLLVLGFVVPLTTGAQNTNTSIEELLAQIRNLQRQIEALRGGSNAVQCFTFNRNLGVGASGRDVRELHNALAREGFPVAGARITPTTNTTRPTIDPSLPQYGESSDSVRNNIVFEENESENENNATDRYTEATAAAVSSFQLKYKDEILTPNGLSAPTGYFGPATRKKMNSLYCNIEVPIPLPTPPYPIPYPTPVPEKQSLTVVSPNGGESWQAGTTQRIGWNWQTNAFVGQSFTIYLTPVNWGPNNPQLTIASGISGTSYYDWSVGKVIGADIAKSQAYYVAVCAFSNFGQTNLYGGRVCDQSDSYFKIYGSDQTGNRPPTVSGVDGPVTLKLGETGTWTVRASDPENGPLSYSVWWGDELLTASGGVSSARPETPVQQTATFTHAYTNPGARYYYPRFTVTDNVGQSNSASLGVSVGEGTVSTNGIDLAVTSFELNADGPRATFCNSGTVAVNSFPLNINIDGVTRTFDMDGYKTPSQRCGLPHQWYYATWGLNSAGSHSAGAQVDPLGIYAETNESNNWLTATYNDGSVRPPSIPYIKVTAPDANSQWRNDFSQAIYWNSNISSNNTITIELLTPSNISASGFAGIVTPNDGSQFANLLNVVPGSYYFRMKTTVDGQTIYSASNVFQVIDNTTIAPTNQPPRIVSAPSVPFASVGAPVEIVLVASDPDGDYLSLSADWGDEIVAVGACASPMQAGKIFTERQELRATHTWQAAEDYTVKLSVSDCRGGQAKYEMKVEVKPQGSTTEQQP